MFNSAASQEGGRAPRRLRRDVALNFIVYSYTYRESLDR